MKIGFLGIWSFLLLWPIIIILHFTGIEPFVLPYRYNLVSVVTTTGFFPEISTLSPFSLFFFELFLS